MPCQVDTSGRQPLDLVALDRAEEMPAHLLRAWRSPWPAAPGRSFRRRRASPAASGGLDRLRTPAFGDRDDADANRDPARRRATRRRRTSARRDADRRSSRGGWGFTVAIPPSPGGTAAADSRHDQWSSEQLVQVAASPTRTAPDECRAARTPAGRSSAGAPFRSTARTWSPRRAASRSRSSDSERVAARVDAGAEHRLDPRRAQAAHGRDRRLDHPGPQASPAGVGDAEDPLRAGEATGAQSAVSTARAAPARRSLPRRPPGARSPRRAVRRPPPGPRAPGRARSRADRHGRRLATDRPPRSPWALRARTRIPAAPSAG